MPSPSRRRRALGWLLPLTLVPAAAVAAVAVSVPDPDNDRARVVFPLDQGTTWVYDVLDHGEPSGTRTSQVIGFSRLIGNGQVDDAYELSRRYTDYPGTGPRESSSWFGITGERIEQYASLENGEMQFLDPAAPSYELPLEEGQQLDYDGLLGTTPFAYEGELVSVGDVEVGGRTFEGCAHWVNQVRFSFDEDEPDVEETLEEWTCPGYGVVRSVDAIEAYELEVTEELTEFHGTTGSWYADGHEPEPLTDLEPSPGGTAGFDAQRAFAVPDGELVPELAWTDARAEGPATAPVAAGSDLVYGERGGTVTLRAATGEVRWRVRVGAPVMTTPTVVGDRVVVGDGTRRLWALSLQDGRALWVHELGDVLSAPPTLTEHGIAVPTEDGVLTQVDATDGEVLWEVRLDGPANTAPALTGSGLLVADSEGTLQSLDPEDGDQTWSRSVAGGVAQGPAVNGDTAFVSDLDGVLHAYDVTDGAERWAASDRNPAFVPLTASDDVVVAVANTRLNAHDADTGRRLWRRALPPVSATPVVVGDQVVVVTRDAELHLIDLATGRTELRQPLPLPAVDDPEVRAGLPPTLVGDDLVFTVSVSGHLSGTVMYAFPVDGRSADEVGGVLLRHTTVEHGGQLNEPPAQAGDDLVVPSAEDLLVLAPDGSTRTIATSPDAVMSRPVVDGDTAYVRVGEELQAVRLADGEVAWAAAAGTAFFGTQPGVGTDTVFFGQEGTGLVAVDKASGAPRWTTPLPDALIVGVPLPLRDGDVVYGGDSLARYDAATGAVVWQVPDAYPLGPVAAAGDLVVAQTLGSQSPSGLGAYDAGTGEQRWFVEQSGVPRDVAPAVADGVVVATDPQGTVTAYDARDGAELWTRTLGLPPAGAPVIADGRVFLSEAGTAAQAGVDPDFRVLALDLATGTFLGAWQPGPMSLEVTGVPLVGGSSDGGLLVPTPLELSRVEAVR